MPHYTDLDRVKKAPVVPTSLVLPSPDMSGYPEPLQVPSIPVAVSEMSPVSLQNSFSTLITITVLNS